ncbi:ADAMTS9 [Cordylochernes scorpioides]|uniref:ADAMTS9 n=1 Tax=Cordylochernes scorpioides TaxID=51811 RepID=A0ABY6KAA7_9ARAC|nr:ADAMTS9 [Cordylochernes scorpioides]
MDQQCSVKCGLGYKYRAVYCSAGGHSPTADIHCNPAYKPRSKRRCRESRCPFQWRAGAWGPCSTTCGRGAPISCQDIQTRVNVRHDGEQELQVRGRYVKVFCFAMNSSQPQEYVTLLAGQAENYAEVYNRRLSRPETCPRNGARMDPCPEECRDDNTAGPGLTTYSRVAVNISSLTLDWDCYSMVHCPQGRFSINLKGTGFVVSPESEWTNEGHFTAAKIHRLEVYNLSN